MASVIGWFVIVVALVFCIAVAGRSVYRWWHRP